MFHEDEAPMATPETVPITDMEQATRDLLEAVRAVHNELVIVNQSLRLMVSVSLRFKRKPTKKAARKRR